MLRKKQTKSREERTAEDYFPVDEEDLKKTTEKQIKETTPKENLLKKSVEVLAKETSPKEEILKGAIEKLYSKPTRKELEKVEYSSSKKTTQKKFNRNGKKRSIKKGGHKIIKETKYTPPKILLKKSGYELIITEKPQAATKIATALGNSTQGTYNKVPYYEVDRQGKKIIVACAVGHLFTLNQNNSGSEVPTFNISWTPNYLVRKNDFTKKYYDTILKLAKNAGSLTVATDFDIEGEVIGLNIVKYICDQKDANRMKFSTLTNSELNKSYENKLPHLEWGQAIAGETRHYLDWFYGINLSRALMNSIKSTGRFKIMSIGRVQGPALKLIVEKEKQIQVFKPQPYWQVFIIVEDERVREDKLINYAERDGRASSRLGGKRCRGVERGRELVGNNRANSEVKKNKLELKHIKDIFDKKELKQFENLVGKTAITETKKSEQILHPNPPFNLTTLQTEAYAFYGITPSRTLQIAQSLYLSGLISYPRTSSQKLPASINYKEILNKLAKKYRVEHLIKKEKPIEGKKSDPAHPSIYPTGEFQILSGEDNKIYNLIVKRFLSLFCEDAIIDNKTIKAIVSNQKADSDFSQSNNNLIFSARGSAIRKKAWLEIYPSRLKEKEIPDMDGEVKIINQKTEEKETQPPKRFSPASIISQLEKRNLGTKATRASILETLYDRGYIKGTSIEATPLGISLIETLEKYSPIIIDEKLTRNFEREMDAMLEKKKNFEKEEKKIIDEAKQTITEIAKDFEKNENKIGKELVKATDDLREQQKIENTLMQCPKCKKGNLAITYSPKTKRNFIACDAYPKCKNTFSLPPNGIIKKANKICESCGFPMLMRIQKGKRPWTFCFNPECETNREWQNRSKEKRNNST